MVKSRLGRIVGSIVALVGGLTLAACSSGGGCGSSCAPKCAPRCATNPGPAVYRRPCCAGPGYAAPRGPMYGPAPMYGQPVYGQPGQPVYGQPAGGSMGPPTPATSYGSPTPQPGAAQQPGHGQMACGAGKCG